MDEIRVQVDSVQLQAALEEKSKQLSDMEPLFDEIGSLLESRVHLRFDMKTDPDGAPWAPWSPRTAAQRARQGRGTLLEFSGRMRDSLAYEAFDDRVEIGFGVDYASVHEFGSRKRGIPARHMLLATDEESLGEEDLADVLDLVRSYFDEH